jgi:hypothetical protein
MVACGTTSEQPYQAGCQPALARLHRSAGLRQIVLASSIQLNIQADVIHSLPQEWWHVTILQSWHGRGLLKLPPAESETPLLGKSRKASRCCPCETHACEWWKCVSPWSPHSTLTSNSRRRSRWISRRMTLCRASPHRPCMPALHRSYISRATTSAAHRGAASVPRTTSLLMLVTLSKLYWATSATHFGDSLRPGVTPGHLVGVEPGIRGQEELGTDQQHCLASLPRAACRCTWPGVRLQRQYPCSRI